MRASRGEALKFFHSVVLYYSGHGCLIWPFATDDKGYARITIGGNHKRVSRLVCEHFRGPPPTKKHDAAHSCGKGHLRCVAKGHLDWKTRKANIADKVEHGTVSRGERNPNVKLSEDDVRCILALKGQRSAVKIAETYGVTNQTISNILTGRTWSWLT